MFFEKNQILPSETKTLKYTHNITAYVINTIKAAANLGWKKNYSCFRKCGWREKSSPGRPQIYFFNRFSGDILFSSLVFFCFFWFLLFVCLFVFFKLKMYILIHIWLCGRLNDKKFSYGRFPKTKLLFLALQTSVTNPVFNLCLLNQCIVTIK